MSIVSEVLSANQHVLSTRISSVWNYYNVGFTSRCNAYKDADLMAMQIASTHVCEFDVYAITGAKGRSGHSKTEIILLAVKEGDEIDGCGRRVRYLFSVRDIA